MTRIALDQLFSFLVFVVVARILGPSDVGLFALGMIVAEVGRIFSTSGFSDAVTKAPPETEEQIAAAAFWGNLGIAVLSAILLTLAAGPIAGLLDTPRLSPVIIALAWTIPVSASYAVHQARQLKRFGHKSLAIRSLIAGVLGGAFAVTAAYAGAGVWSLVVQRGLTELITLGTMWFVYRWMPPLRFSWTQLKEILPFSMQMSVSRLGNLSITRFQDVVIGAYVSAAGVGVYRVAKRTIDMMASATMESFSSVALNLFATVRGENERLRQSIVRMIGASATVAFPIFAGVAVVAGDLINLIYGPKWTESVAMLQLLSPLCVPLLFSLLTLNILTICGASRAVSFMTIAKLVLTVILSLLVAPYGIKAVILAYVGRLYLFLPVELTLVSRYSGVRVGAMGLAIARPLLASLVMAGLAYAALHYVYAALPYAILRLIITSALGGLIYVGLLWLIDRPSLLWFVDLARGYARRDGGPAMAKP